MADEKATVPGDQKDAKAEPSGYRGDNPSTGGKGNTQVSDGSAEQGAGSLDPSAPGNTGTTPGTNVRQG